MSKRKYFITPWISYLFLGVLAVCGCNGGKKSPGETAPLNDSSADALPNQPMTAAAVQNGTPVAPADDSKVVCERYMTIAGAVLPQGYNPDVPECQIYNKKVFAAAYAGATFSEKATHFTRGIPDVQALANAVAQASGVPAAPNGAGNGSVTIKCNNMTVSSVAQNEAVAAASDLVNFVNVNCQSND